MENNPPEKQKNYSELACKAEISERLDYVRQFAYGLDENGDEEFLKWLKNRLTETYRVVQKKLKPESS